MDNEIVQATRKVKAGLDPLEMLNKNSVLLNNTVLKQGGARQAMEDINQKNRVQNSIRKQPHIQCESRQEISKKTMMKWSFQAWRFGVST